MPVNVSNREAVDAKSVILAVVATKTVLGNAIAVVTAALLPITML